MNQDAREQFNTYIQRLWSVGVAPTRGAVISLLRDARDEWREEIIRVLMARCSPTKEDLLGILEDYPEYVVLVLQWLPLSSLLPEDLIFIMQKSTNQRVREGIGLMLLNEQAGVDTYLKIARVVPALQEYIWSLYRCIPATESVHRAYVELAKTELLLRERIAKYFIALKELHLDGLFVALWVKSTSSEAAARLLSTDDVGINVCMRVLSTDGLAHEHNRRACYLILKSGMDSIDAMLSVMDASRQTHQGDFVTSTNRFVELIQQQETADSIPMIKQALSILDPPDDPYRNTVISVLGETLHRLESANLTEADRVVQSIRALA